MMKWRSGGPAAVLLTLAAFLLSASGCLKNNHGSATVRGKVLYNDVPIEFGAVVFHNDAGMLGICRIQPQGNYFLVNLPEGEVKICVKARDRDFTMKKRASQQKGESPTPTETSRFMDRLTAKYGHVETTPLSFTIQGGEQQHDIILSLP
jgi:hypothetical protein